MPFPISPLPGPRGSLLGLASWPLPNQLGGLAEHEGLGIFARAVGLALLSIVVILVWLRGQRELLRRQRERDKWLRAAWDGSDVSPADIPASKQVSRAIGLPPSTGSESQQCTPPEALQAKAGELARAGEVLEVLGGFAAGVASDFNNQLTTILGHANLLRESPGLDEDVARSLGEICRAGEEGRRSTRQLMAFSGSGIRRSGRHMLSPFLRELCTQVSERHGVPIRVHESPCAAAIEGNLDELRIALEALLNNAAEASSDGTVVVRCEAAPRGDEAGGASTNVRVSVLDSGPGLQSIIGNQVFQPGFSTRPGSHGLGLPIALTLAARNGGSVVLKDARANGLDSPGTLAELYLRRAHPAKTLAPKSGLRPGTTHGQPVILVVEDQRPVRELVTKVLTRAGYSVLAAGSGEEALEIAQAQEINLLLTDVCLPRMDGLELAENMGQRFPGVPCVYTSGMVQNEELRNQLFGTMPHFVQKPFTPIELIEVVRTALSFGIDGTRQRVLVVDDDSLTRRLVRAIVEDEGYECVVAADGSEALDHMRLARFNLVVTDIVMPVLDGIDLCRAIISGFPTVRIIAMSGNRAGRSGLDMAVRLGAERVLVKPFSRDELSLVIRQVLGNSDSTAEEDRDSQVA